MSAHEVVFFRMEAGNEPVREWLRGLVREDRKTVGEDIKTAQFGWPIGMPLIRKLATGLWEVRSHISTGIARVMFTVDGQTMVLLKMAMASRMKTSRAALDRLLDPSNPSVTIGTLEKAAAALNRRLKVELR